MRVISDTSPLQYLHVIRQLPLLEQLYGQIVVPQAVIDELNVGRQQGYDVPDCSAYDWIQPETVPIPSVLKLITNLVPVRLRPLRWRLHNQPILCYSMMLWLVRWPQVKTFATLAHWAYLFRPSNKDWFCCDAAGCGDAASRISRKSCVESHYATHDIRMSDHRRGTDALA
jgi:hypothetical protein